MCLVSLQSKDQNQIVQSHFNHLYIQISTVADAVGALSIFPLHEPLHAEGRLMQKAVSFLGIFPAEGPYSVKTWGKLEIYTIYPIYNHHKSVFSAGRGVRLRGAK